MTTVLITGANRGIGLALTTQYAAAGAAVIACCRQPTQAADLKKLAETPTHQVRILSLDLKVDASIDALARELEGQAIDIVINNAGVVGPKEQSDQQLDVEGWIAALRINAIAPVLVARALKRHLQCGSGKKLVAIGCIDGSTSNGDGGSYALRSSKAALHNAMRNLSRDWAADGIQVGILEPGWVRTESGGPQALISAEESARGLKQRIDELSLATSGVFQDYLGRAVRW